MRFGAIWIALFALPGVSASCKKENKKTSCFPDLVTTRKIINKKAMVKLTATLAEPVYLVEEGSIDTRLLPCNLPMEYYQHDLPVTISGEVKASRQTGLAPCCTENLVITAISR